MQNLKICSWNINLGFKLDQINKELSNPNFQNMDILFLQECSLNEEPLLGINYKSLEAKSQKIKGRSQGNAIIWNTKKFKLSSAWSVPLPNYRTTKIARTESLFLNRIRPQKRTALAVEGKIGKTTLRLYCLHLDVLGWEHKKAQLSHLLTIDQTLKAVDLTILCGDLNTISIARLPRYKSLKTLMKDHEFADLSSHIKSTFKGRQKLDFIWLKNRSKMQFKTHCWTLPTKGSDHLPLLAELTNENGKSSNNSH